MKLSTKNIDIFVSSTFLDMHDERDLINSTVARKVNDILEPMGLRVNFIDLRWGVNTMDADEADRETLVLYDCLETIRKTRPYFLALIGGRYGYLPSETAYRIALHKQKNEINTLDDEPQKSVTALEIEYGALSDYLYFQKSIFCFRDNSSYDNMDTETHKLYIDKDQSRLDELKNKINYLTELYDLQANIISYKCSWKNGHMTDFGDFPDILAQRIAELVQNEVDNVLDIDTDNEYAKHIANDKIICEELSLGYIRGPKIFQLSDGTVDLIDSIASVVTSENRIKLLIADEMGTGKTTTLAALYKAFLNVQGYTPLIHFSRRDRSTAHMLKKWLFALGTANNYSVPDDIHVNVQDLLRRLHNTVKGKKEKIIFFIDDITYLDDIFVLNNTDWLQDQMYLVATCNIKELNYTNIKKDYFTLSIPKDEDSLAQIISSFLFNRQHKTLSHNALTEIVKKSNLVSEKESGIIWSIIVADELAKFDINDFRNINEIKEGRADEKIEKYQIEYIKKCPLSSDKLLSNTVERICSQYEKNFIHDVLSVTSLFSQGVPILYLREILADTWDELTFSAIRSRLSIYLDNSDWNRLAFSHESIRIHVLKNYNNAVSSRKTYNYLTKELNFAPNDDFLCIESLFVAMSGKILDLFSERLFFYKYARGKAINTFLREYALNNGFVSPWIFDKNTDFRNDRIRFLMDAAWYCHSAKLSIVGLHLAGILSQLAIEWVCGRKIHSEIYVLVALHSFETNEQNVSVSLQLAEQDLSLFDQDIALDNLVLGYYYLLRSKASLKTKGIEDACENAMLSTGPLGWLLKNGVISVFDDLKEAEQIYASTSIQLDSRKQYLDEYNEELYDGQAWMMEIYRYASNALVANKWLNGGSCSTILFADAMHKMDILSDLSQNEHFYAGYVKGQLNIFRERNEDMCDAVIQILEDLDAYDYHDDITDVQIQCLFYLHGKNPSEYDRYYIEDYVDNHLDIEDVSNTNDYSYLYSIIKMYIYLGRNEYIVLDTQDVQTVLMFLSYVVWNQNDTEIQAKLLNYISSKNIDKLPITDEFSKEMIQILRLRNLLLGHFSRKSQDTFNSYDHFKESCKVFEKMFSVSVQLTNNDLLGVLMSHCFEKITKECEQLFKDFKDDINHIVEIRDIYKGVFRAFRSVKMQGDYNCWCKSKAYCLLTSLYQGYGAPRQALDYQARRNWLLLWLYKELGNSQICIELGKSIKNTLDLLNHIEYNSERYLTYLLFANSIYDNLTETGYDIANDQNTLVDYIDISYQLIHWFRLMGKIDEAEKKCKEVMNKSHQDILKLWEEYGILLHLKGDDHQAEKWLIKVHKAYKRGYDESEEGNYSACMEYVENAIATSETFLDMNFSFNKIESVTKKAHKAIEQLWEATKEVHYSIHFVSVKYIRLIVVEATLYIKMKDVKKVSKLVDELKKLSDFYCQVEDANNAITEVLHAYSNISKVSVEHEFYDLAENIVDVDYELRKKAAECHIIKAELTDIEEYRMRKFEARGATVYRY